MGVWGPGPFESDAALDWLGNRVTDHLAAEVTGLCGRFDDDGAHAAEELRAAGKLLATLADADVYLSGHFERYTDVAERLRGPGMDPWLATWLRDAEREAVRRDLAKTADRLDDLASQLIHPAPGQTGEA